MATAVAYSTVDQASAASLATASPPTPRVDAAARQGGFQNQVPRDKGGPTSAAPNSRARPCCRECAGVCRTMRTSVRSEHLHWRYLHSDALKGALYGLSVESAPPHGDCRVKRSLDGVLVQLDARSQHCHDAGSGRPIRHARLWFRPSRLRQGGRVHRAQRLVGHRDAVLVCPRPRTLDCSLALCPGERVVVPVCRHSCGQR
eukprot:scaffold8243_cov129-Isochrysis_galbana.AAC.9